MIWLGKRIIFLLSLVYALCPKDEYKPRNEINVFSLPTLPYNYKELEPVLWSQIVYFHHKKEHAKFIEPLNLLIAEDSTYESLTVTDLIIQFGLQNNDIALNAGGYYNHALLWWSLLPSSCNKHQPEGQLLEDIEMYFGDFETFKDEFSRRAISLFGSGWIWLCRNPDGHLIINGKNSEYSPLAGNECLPLLGIDMWEHAYYLFYMDDIEDYVYRWWGIVDWELIEYWYQEYVSQGLPVPV